MATAGSIKLNVHLDISAGLTELTRVGGADLTVELPLRAGQRPGDQHVTVAVDGLEDRLRRAAEAFERALTEERD